MSRPLTHAERFVAANERSPVVMGEVLSREKCIEAEKLAGGPPRWKLPTEENTRA